MPSSDKKPETETVPQKIQLCYKNLSRVVGMHVSPLYPNSYRFEAIAIAIIPIAFSVLRFIYIKFCVFYIKFCVFYVKFCVFIKFFVFILSFAFFLY